MSTEAYTMTGDRPVEVLLAGSDPEYLERVAGRVTEDDVQVHTVATTDMESAIARLDDGSVDCLIATYNPGANEGLPILDYLRDDDIEVPVILLPSGPTTVVVSENLVVDIAGVFTREEAVGRNGTEGGLGPDVVVDAVQERQASEAAKRRRGLERAIESVARELSAADRREEIDRSLVDGMADTDEVDGAWMTEVDGDRVAIRDRADADTDAPPPTEGPAGDAVRRALATEQPQVTHHDGTNYAAVPVTPENGEPGVLTMASNSRYAFSDEETRVLRDVGDTASRSIDDVARRLHVGSAAVKGQEAFETVLERLSVPVVAYGDAGWVAGANESFADLADAAREDIVGQPVWDVLPSPTLETFEDYWASFSPGETRTQLVEFDTGFRQLVTTRVAVGDEEYNVSLAVEQVDESADPWFADVLAYEFRHWLAIAEEALTGETDEDEEAVVDAVVERMQDAMNSEVQAAKAGSRSGAEDLVLEEPSGAAGADAGADADPSEVEVEVPDVDLDPDEIEADAVEVDRAEVRAGEVEGNFDLGGDDTAGAADSTADAVDIGGDDLGMEESQLAEAAASDDDGFELEPQPVSGMARDAWMTVVGEFGEYEIRGQRKVLADDTLLHRLFAHLFRTLFSYGKASGVDVGVTDDGFFVEDDGSGVPHAQREYADAQTMTDARSGAGIRVAERLADRHGWDLDVEANDAGGTRFVISGARIRDK